MLCLTISTALYSFVCWVQVGPEQAEAYLISLGLSGMVRTMLVLLLLTHLHMLPLHACMRAHTYHQYTPDQALPVLAVQ